MTDDKDGRGRRTDTPQRGERLDLNFGRRAFNLRECIEAGKGPERVRSAPKKLPPKPGRTPAGSVVPAGEVLNPHQRRKS